MWDSYHIKALGVDINFIKLSFSATILDQICMTCHTLKVNILFWKFFPKSKVSFEIIFWLFFMIFWGHFELRFFNTLTFGTITLNPMHEPYIQWTFIEPFLTLQFIPNIRYFQTTDNLFSNLRYFQTSDTFIFKTQTKINLKNLKYSFLCYHFYCFVAF